jgi:hypothetical protein
MATIDAKKLLPPSKKTAAIEKQKFLVPLQNISVNKKPAGDLRPVDKETKSSEDLSIVKKKINQLSLLLNESYLIEKKDREARRKAEERRKFEQREKNIEKKVKKNQVSSNLIPSIPGQSIFDKINRFIGFTLLGYLFNNYGKILPKLLEFGSVLKPVGEFVESFAKNLLKGAIDFVEFGYKAYDQTRDFVKQVGGEGAQKTFDEFSKNLNLLLNGAIAASMLVASTSPGRPGRPGKPGRMPGGKSPSLPRNAKLSSYLGRDAQTKLIERRYGNDAARMYEARKSQGASASRARADVLKRFDKFEGPQRGLAGGTGKGSILSRGFGKSANRAALKVLGKTGTRIAKGVFGRVPIIGGLLDFAFSLAMGENPGRAAAKAVGATVGSALGTLIPIPGVGTIAGGILGDIVGGAMYDALAGSKKPEGRAEGGQISGGSQKSVAPSRRIKTTTRKAPPRIQPQKTQPGKDVGGKLKIEELYGEDQPGQRSALRALRKSSEDVKKVKSINGLVGSMFGAGIDMALGQKPDKNLSRNIGNIFGSVISSAIDMELNKSFGDISKTIAMAGGGAVPSREIGRQLSIGERIGSFISRALAVSIESSATRILQNLRNEMNMEGDGTGDGDGGGGGGGAGNVIVSSDSPDFWLLAVGSLLENSHPQGAADVAQVIYNRVASPSWPNSIRNVILEGNGGQFQPVRDYGNITAWKSIKDKQSAIDFIKRYGKGRTQSQLESVAAALLDTSRQGSARTFVGPRDSFRATSFEDKNNHLADDTEQRRHGHVFGFEPGGAQIAAFRAGKLSPAQVSPQTTGTVTQKPTTVSGNVKDTGIVDYKGRPIKLKGILADAFIDMAAAYRKETGKSLGPAISSSFRTPQENSRVNGATGSLHLTGEAFDINWYSPGGVWIQNNAKNYGFRYNPYSGESTHFEWKGGYTPKSKPAQPPAPAPAAKPAQPPSPPPSQVRNNLTRSNQWDPSQSGLRFNPKTGKYEKASLAPTPSAVASLNRSGVLETDTSNMYGVKETIVAFQIVEKTMQPA